MLFEVEEGFAGVGEGIEAIIIGEVGLEEFIVERKGFFPIFLFGVASGKSEAGVEGDLFLIGVLFDDAQIEGDGFCVVSAVFVGKGLVVEGSEEMAVHGVIGEDDLVDLDGLCVAFLFVGGSGELVEFAEVELIDSADTSVFGAKQHGIDLNLEDGSGGGGFWGRVGCLCREMQGEEKNEREEKKNTGHGKTSEISVLRR